MTVRAFCLLESLAGDLDLEIVDAPFEDIIGANVVDCLIVLRGRLIADLEGLTLRSASLVSVLYRYVRVFKHFASESIVRPGATLTDILACKSFLRQYLADQFVSAIARRIDDDEEGVIEYVTSECSENKEQDLASQYFCKLAVLIYAVLKARHIVNVWKKSVVVLSSVLKLSGGRDDHNGGKA